MKHLFMFYVVFFGALFTVAYLEQHCTDATMPQFALTVGV